MPLDTIPPIGFGTWRLNGPDCVRAVGAALETGYRLLDTAARYRNEAEVGDAIRNAGVPREDLFIVTKVWPTDLADDDFQRSVDESLDRLGIDAIDLLLIHWPQPGMPVADMMRPLSRTKASGQARRIGVSNFNLPMLLEAVATASEPLSALECEYHPYLDQSKLLAECRRLGLTFVAYSPLGRRNPFDEPDIHDIATRLGRTPAQIILRWLLDQEGVVPIPKSGNPVHIRQNFDVFGFSLTPADRETISALADSGGRIVDNNSFAPDWNA